MSTAQPSDHPRGSLSDVLLSEVTAAGLLQIVVELAVRTIGGVAGASISQLVGGSDAVETTHASSETARIADQAQYESGQGPCVEAIRTRAEVKISIPTDRWPAFSSQAEDAGLHSVLALPLQVQGRTTGALNLYSHRREPLAGLEADVARVLAREVAVVLANAAALSTAELTNESLEDALVSRDLIGQAKGILMARQGVTADEAFDLLRRRSQRTGRKLRDIAVEIATHPTADPKA